MTHKTKVIAGIVIIVIASILLGLEILRGVLDEISYQRCMELARVASGTIICHHFIDHVVYSLYYSVTIAIGVFVWVCGIKSISLKSFSRK